MTEIFTVSNLIALLTLTGLEIVLGIDNIVFLAILSGKLPEADRNRARVIGLSLALIMRVLLLLGIKWIMGLTETLFTVLGHDVTGKDIILLAGGIFLIAKSTHEIHEKLEGAGDHEPHVGRGAKFGAVVAQIVMLDLVFSLDSVITAVGMVQHVPIMIAAVVIAIIIMMTFAGPVSRFIEKHPTIKMLGLSFLLLIGVMLVAEGSGKHIERGYVYFAMAFSLFTEMLNIRTATKKAKREHTPAPR